MRSGTSRRRTPGRALHNRLNARLAEERGNHTHSHQRARARRHFGCRLWSGRQCRYSLICKMRERNIILNPYLDQEMVEQIHAAMGISSADELQGDDGIEEQLGDDY